MSEADRDVIAAINAQAGLGLTWTGRAAEGTLGGAIFVDLPDGAPGVVTRYLGPPEAGSLVAAARRTASVLDLARSRDLPVPRHHAIVAVGEDVFVVQERLPGSPPARMTPAVAEAIVELNDRFAHLLADHPEIPALPLCLTASGDPYPRHEVLAAHSARSRRILAAIRAAAGDLPDHAPGDDLLHIDLDAANLLFDENGTVTGVVDWNLGAYRGDRHLALVKTRFEQEWALRTAHPDPDVAAAADRLDHLLTHRVPAATLHRYWSHRLLNQLHWALQLDPPDVVAWHLDVAEERLL